MNFSEKLNKFALLISIVLTAVNVILLAINLVDAAFITGIISVIFEILYLRGTALTFVVSTLKKGWKIGWNLGGLVFIPGVRWVFALMGAMVGICMIAVILILVILFLPVVPVLWYRFAV